MRNIANSINVLIACEESQAECLAFRHYGFNAFSCDVQKCRDVSRGGHPEWHILGDVTPLLHGCNDFKTQDGVQHHVYCWHMIIAHPPCTYMCRVGSVHMIVNGKIVWERFRLMIKARRFFMECLNASAEFVAVENPIPMSRAQLPPPSCFIQPSWYGVKYTKKTLYWTKNLPPLMSEYEYPNPKCYVTSSRGKYRSRTFPQVADAIARQWGGYVVSQIEKEVSR